jgi:NhaP-type Na+/H+ or K+/H+ antiporter
VLLYALVAKSSPIGPKGLASIFLVLIAMERSESLHGIGMAMVLVTVFINVFAHGITAVPPAKRYGSRSGG